jgi:hypothetical protein
VPLEAFVGIALIGFALVLRYIWALDPNARLALVVAALALDRVVLSATSPGGWLQWKLAASIAMLATSAFATTLYLIRAIRLGRQRHHLQRGGLDQG